jgi:uncharacterized protein DUF3854/uncharacterized protein DUF927
MATWRNVRRGTPCPICGKATWCSTSDDGAWALCRRVDAGGVHRVDRSGMDYWLHRLVDGPVAPRELADEPSTDCAGPSDLDRVYRAVLRHLSLTSIHRKALISRGLDNVSMADGLYRTLPPRGRAEIGREVLERFAPQVVLSVPGFHLSESDSGSYVTFAGPSGLLIPVLDLAGRVIALKVRRDRVAGDEPRFVYVSSSGHGGAGPGAPVHVPAWRKAAMKPLDDHDPEPTERFAGTTVRVTEGEIKAHVAMQLSGALTISVAGVSAWRSALPLLRLLRPKRVLLAFDRDGATNPHVARATQAAADALLREGWEVGVETWDGAQAKGIDDALACGVPIDVRITTVPDTTATEPRSEHAVPGVPSPPAGQGHPYRATRDGLFWQRPTKDGSIDLRLTNFAARVVADIAEDDGAEVRRRFEIEARINGSRSGFTVAAESFASMGWATEQLGARAIIFPGFGIRDHARAAVQILSGHIPERRVFSHSGWRDLGTEGWAYLHAGGAINRRGLLGDVEVSLPESLARLELPLPPHGEELQRSIRMSLAVLDVVPDPIGLPLLAAVWRGALGDTDFSLHLAGSSGAGKSELAALAQRHFGPGMDARHFPGSWSSTANALEGLAFAGKDALLVVDDFAPGGGQYDAERAHREADRVLRAQGNRSGRLRMRADGTLRPAKPPRGLILSTGEDVPRGQSLRARMLVMEVAPGDVNWTAMTACQEAASEGANACALSGFLRFVAGRYDEVQESVHTWIPRLRHAAARSGTHQRTPDIVANLAAGFAVFLRFAHVAGLAESECDQLWRRAWTAFGQAAAAQGDHQAGAEPAGRFLELLRGAIASGRAHLADPRGNRPDVVEGAWGWRRNDGGAYEAKGERVGWLDGDNVYLEPEAAYAAVQRLGQEIGDRIALTPQTLRKRLKERGLLKSTAERRGTLTLRRTLEGQRRDVLHLAAEALSPCVGESPQSDQPADAGSAEAISWSALSAGWAGVGSSSNGHMPTKNGHHPAASSPLGKLGKSLPQEKPSSDRPVE